MSATITILGIYDQGTLAAVFGAVLAAILALQQAFPFAETSFFYRVGVAEANILKLDLDVKADTIEEVENIEMWIEVLMRNMAKDVPRGAAVLDTVQRMREELEES